MIEQAQKNRYVFPSTAHQSAADPPNNPHVWDNLDDSSMEEGNICIHNNNNLVIAESNNSNNNANSYADGNFSQDSDGVTDYIIANIDTTNYRTLVNVTINTENGCRRGTFHGWDNVPSNCNNHREQYESSSSNNNDTNRFQNQESSDEMDQKIAGIDTADDNLNQDNDCKDN
jgi:hypothetical protein